MKGGVAKTVTAVNLAAYFALSKNRVLLIDLDAQSASTHHLGYDFRRSRHVETVYDSLVGDTPLEKVVIGTGIPLLHLAPSNINLTGAEYELHDVRSREFILKKVLSSIEDKYDFIIVDCPPSLGIIVINALVASNVIIIPIHAEFLSLSGLRTLLDIIKTTERKVHKKVTYRILLTMFDGRLRLSREALEVVKKHFGDCLFQTIIPQNVTVAEAAGHGVPLASYNDKCKGAQAYRALAQEIINGVVKK